MNSTEAITFSVHSVGVNNREYPTEYSISPNGVVFVFVAM